nr:hypothetical protein [Tanacetum cinerariifolium]
FYCAFIVLKAFTTRSGIVLDGPSIPIPPPFINPKEDERVEETLTDQNLTEYTIKVPPPLVQKSKPHSQRNFVILILPKIFIPPHNINPLSGNTTSSSPNHLLERFVDELALITFPPGNDDLLFDIESDLKEIEYLLHHDPIKDMDSILKDSVSEDNLVDLYDNLANTMPEMFTDEHALDYSSPLLYDEYDDDPFEVESDTEYVYDDPFDSKGEKIKESKLLINELDLPRDFIPSLGYDSFLSEDFSKVDALPLTNNEDKDFDPLLYELPFFKEVP